MYEKKPWLKFYGGVPHSLNYPRTSMYEAIHESIEKYPDNIAYTFLDGKKSTYRQLKTDIEQCADALSSLGLKKGDRVTISMPTSPPGIICFYALNKLGVVASMIHPLSPPGEIEFYLNYSRSTAALTVDIFYSQFEQILDKTEVKTLILAKIQEYLPPVKSSLYWLVKGRKVPKINDPRVTWFGDLMKGRYPKAPEVRVDPDDLAVILYSGGTTGKPKGIMLSNYNFLSEGMMVSEWSAPLEQKSGMKRSESVVLAMLPIFHGFGLGVCINATLIGGGRCVLVPTFTPELAADMIKKTKPTLLIGVPTLFESLSRNKRFRAADHSRLIAAFSGADTLPRVVKEGFESIVRMGGSKVNLLEGYGLTEAVTAIMATPVNHYREKSVGVPFPDMEAKIVKINTTETVPVGQEGELCLRGPAVMLGYLDQPEETAGVLKTHADGKTWLHTGDIFTMDEDGFFYFKLREKRMIKSSGMNVYPAQVEEVLYRHPDVEAACVIGVPDKAQVERVKAFVVLKDKSKASPEKGNEIIEFCRTLMIKWSCPREIEFRDDLPKTLVGKIAFKELEKQELEKLKAAGEYAGDK
jgi:long-chain acyl-CoA synthetase